MGQHIRCNGTKYSLSIFFWLKYPIFWNKTSKYQCLVEKYDPVKCLLDNFVIANHAVELRQFCWTHRSASILLCKVGVRCQNYPKFCPSGLYTSPDFRSLSDYTTVSKNSVKKLSKILSKKSIKNRSKNLSKKLSKSI